VLEIKYGGSKPNIENFFPPDFSVAGEQLLTKKEVLAFKNLETKPPSSKH
jgi:hypothetical protein